MFDSLKDEPWSTVYRRVVMPALHSKVEEAASRGQNLQFAHLCPPETSSEPLTRVLSEHGPPIALMVNQSYLNGVEKLTVSYENEVRSARLESALLKAQLADANAKALISSKEKRSRKGPTCKDTTSAIENLRMEMKEDRAALCKEIEKRDKVIERCNKELERRDREHKQEIWRFKQEIEKRDQQINDMRRICPSYHQVRCSAKMTKK
eukprot:m51a1_g1187 hypothetical protein (208) ;mRNA; r:406381-409496